jgi:phosphoserine/homoserine phosphotransferase
MKTLTNEPEANSTHWQGESGPAGGCFTCFSSTGTTSLANERVAPGRSKKAETTETRNGETTETTETTETVIPQRPHFVLSRTTLLRPRPRLGKITPVKQTIVTLDMEGVLTPEIWIAVAEKTGIKELQLTTRDIPDYDVLMKGRLKILAEHGLGIKDIQDVIGTLEPLPGARQFLDELRTLTQVIILSDTFAEFAQPLMKHLGWPTLFCHRLEIENGKVVNYRLRIPEQKREAVLALRNLNFHVIAAGDSFNDTAMLAAAHLGYLFRAPASIQAQFPQFKAVEEYHDLLNLIKKDL